MSLTKKKWEADKWNVYAVLMYFPILIGILPFAELRADNSFQLQLTLMEKSAAKGCILEQGGEKKLIYAKSIPLWSNQFANVFCRSLNDKTVIKSIPTNLQSIDHVIPFQEQAMVIGKTDSLILMSISPKATVEMTENLTALGFTSEPTQAVVNGDILAIKQKNRSLLFNKEGKIIAQCAELLWFGTLGEQSAYIHREGNRTEYVAVADNIRWRLPNFQYYCVQKSTNGDNLFLMTNFGSTYIHLVVFSDSGSMKSMRQIESKMVVSPIHQQSDGIPIWISKHKNSLFVSVFLRETQQISAQEYHTNFEQTDEVSLFCFDDKKNIFLHDNFVTIIDIDNFGTHTLPLRGMPDVTWKDKTLIINDSENMWVFEVTHNPYWFYYEIVNNHSEKVILFFAVIILISVLVTATKNRKIMNILLDKNSAIGIIIVGKKGQIKEVNAKAEELLTQNTKGKYFVEIMNNLSDEFSETAEKILKERRGGSGVYPMHFGADIREYSIEWIPVMSWMGTMQLMVVRINDLTNALERRRLMDWAHLAHDMQTNLSVIRLSAESLPNDNEEYNRQKVKILNQATILLRRVRDIMTIARNKTTEFQKISSEEICRRVIDELDTSSLYSITVKTNIQSTFFDADPERIIRAIMNAAQNGIKAMAGTEGILTITTFANQESVCFTISDTGVGMDEETKKNMFVPFFTTSRRGGGSGIGSMVIQKTMNDHNGKITIDSQIGEGTTITFIFPKKQSQGVKI